MDKTIMMLGGNYYQMTAVKSAKELGCRVITVDYLPDNPAHKYADEYYNVSTTDMEGILKLAESLRIDGIISYASDISAPTAAYVAEKMGLPTNPYESVLKLTHKDMTRSFMQKHQFNTPKGRSFQKYEEACRFFEELKRPVMIKPVDASGSKGVSKIYEEWEFESAYHKANEYSSSKTIMVEEFIERDGYQIAGDGFLVDGELVFAGFMNEHFDRLCNPLVPIGESYPSVLSDKLKEKGRLEIQRLLSYMGIKNGAVNMDFIVDKNEQVYILEIGPRNGGNLITDIIKCASGIDLAKYTVMSALGMDCSQLQEEPVKTFTSSYIIHALNDGVYRDIQISDDIKEDIMRFDMFVSKGDKVYRFNNGGYGIGAMLIKHRSADEMLYRMDHMEEYIKVIV